MNHYSSSSSSLRETIVVKGSHEFNISGYSLMKGIGSGKYLASYMFTAGGHDWCIYFYPDGKNPDDNASYVSLFIVLASQHSKNVKALFELTLLDQSGNQRHKVHSQFQSMPESGPYTLMTPGSMW
ncbi:hypothetical protein RIF29_20561 [Crotalaria pallida]|uniref:MATH domain-containing protein n=1 Tax=Crotalaria pallida TaxID=3830 RepID=A0AAN9ICI7_CROPI